MGRYKDALSADDGACNPVALVKSLDRHMTEMRNREGFAGWPELTSDPALRLMMHQLAYLFGVLDLPLMQYSEIRKSCEAAAERENADA